MAGGNQTTAGFKNAGLGQRSEKILWKETGKTVSPQNGCLLTTPMPL